MLQSLAAWAGLWLVLYACAVFAANRQHPTVVEYLNAPIYEKAANFPLSQLQAYRETRKDYALIALGAAFIISQTSVILTHTEKMSRSRRPD
ncbi:hypothetical protein H5P28_12760 [Ruficoccus amylovorans]|uniref:Uncharacterized protein n=1 Tax=Ruficoccus amylovorans TaxID=1804625 RepID=A0A842HIW6_9BACT|nr:hypothetical protein [Ruficoccus amylovorans]MBC2595131.1 hypothetical protein [Ruficoccus amylovorans]